MFAPFHYYAGHQTVLLFDQFLEEASISSLKLTTIPIGITPTFLNVSINGFDATLQKLGFPTLFPRAQPLFYFVVGGFYKYGSPF